MRTRAWLLCLPLLCLPLLGTACERPHQAWIEDLSSHDVWRRRMAVLALRQAEEGEVESNLRALLLVLDDPDPAVVAAAREACEALAPRAVPFLARCLRLMPADPGEPTRRRRHRDFVLELLRRRSAAGDARARELLRAHLQTEVESGDPLRMAAAQAVLDELD